MYQQHLTDPKFPKDFNHGAWDWVNLSGTDPKNIFHSEKIYAVIFIYLGCQTFLDKSYLKMGRKAFRIRYISLPI